MLIGHCVFSITIRTKLTLFPLQYTNQEPLVLICEYLKLKSN